MNKTIIFGLKFLKKRQSSFMGLGQNKMFGSIQGVDMVSFIIYDALMSEKACMVAGFGKTELAYLANYIGVENHRKGYIKSIKEKIHLWWSDQNNIDQLQQISGFFPSRVDKIGQFCELILQDILVLDLLLSRLPNERLFDKELTNCKKIAGELLLPFFSSIPWTMALKGKKVLVIHPLADTIQKQYLKRDLLFKNELLPEFELQTVIPTFSIVENEKVFNEWFDILDNIKTEIDKQEFDICLIGDCGAYGFALAAHVKRMGKKAIEFGGSLGPLFGIYSKRGEFGGNNSNYKYTRLINEYWVKKAN